MKRKKAYFSISAVAEMFSVHQQTIRLYEKEGLITPKRSEGNTRLFSEEDVDRLEQIIHLTHDLGINLAGVEMILKLQKQIKKLQKEINVVFDATNSTLEQEVVFSKKRAETSARKLLELKKGSKDQQDAPVAKQRALPLPPADASEKNSSELLDDPWQIEYEE